MVRFVSLMVVAMALFIAGAQAQDGTVCVDGSCSLQQPTKAPELPIVRGTAKAVRQTVSILVPPYESLQQLRTARYPAVSSASTYGSQGSAYGSQGSAYGSQGSTYGSHGGSTVNRRLFGRLFNR